MNSNLTSEHLAWILNISREWKRNYGPVLTSGIIQDRMDTQFPASEHVMIWERLLVAVGAR